MKRILVYGGRDMNDEVELRKALDVLLRKHSRLTLVHGDCPTGADALAARWARDNRVPLEPHPADWLAHERAAGPIRNQEMADSGLDGAVEFPGGRGTADMRRRLNAAGVPVWEAFVDPTHHRRGVR